MISLPDIILPKRDFFGLSIDRTTLRGVQLDRSGKIIKVSEVKFPQEVFSQNSLVNEKVLLASLTAFKEQGKFTTPYVVVCFPEAFAFTRAVTLPVVPPKELKEAVGWHTKDLFPFPESELYIDWKIVRKVNKEYNLAVVAVPKKTIDPIVAGLLMAGFKPLRLKPDASLIAQLLRLEPEQHALVTEVNRTVAYVTLVEGEKALFTTVIPFTKDDTPNSYLHNINQTISEIKAYYIEKQILKDEKVDIVLTGEVATDQWLKELPTPSKILTTPIRNPAYNKAYAVAVSQAVPKPEKETINLLPTLIQEQYDTEQTILYYKTLLIRVTSVVGAYCVLVGIVLVIVMLYSKDLDNQGKQLTAQLSSSQQSSQSLLRVNATAKQIIDLAPYRKSPKEKYEQFKKLIPAGVTLTQWDYDDTKLQFTIVGIAKNRDDLLALKENLETSQLFTKINLPLTFLESPFDINFSLSFNGK